MKLIHKFKSPSFNNRKAKNIKYIIIHYTALKDIHESINFLCDPSNKVSSHFLISKVGTIYNLVDLNKRAWHAGKSYWDGDIDINSLSIGIELDYSPISNKNFSYSKLSTGSIVSIFKRRVKVICIK